VPGIQELIVIAVVALLVFGPDRLPEVARSAARFVAHVRNETQRSVTELKRAAAVEGLDREIGELRREIREARDSVVGPQGSPGRPVDARSAAGQAMDVGSAGDPPPVDPEAT